MRTRELETSEPITLYEVGQSVCEVIIVLAVLVCCATITGCGGSAHATPAKIDVPTIIIHPDIIPTRDRAPLAEVTTSPVAPPAVLRDAIFPPKAAVQIDTDTYRACTCGDTCTCANCPDDCNLVARGDCPGGVCLLPQRSVLTRNTVNHSAAEASGDCGTRAAPLRGVASGVAKRAAKVATAPARFIVRRVFRRGG